MNWYVKEKCKECEGCGWEYAPGDADYNQACSKCDGKGCVKIGLLTFVFLFIARQMFSLIRRYGE